MNFPIHSSGAEVIKAWKLPRTDEWFVKLNNKVYLLYSDRYGYTPDLEFEPKLQYMDIFSFFLYASPDYVKPISRFKNL